MKVDGSLSGNVLFELLKTLTPEEFTEFEKFAASPYFNKGRNYSSLLKALRKFYPGFDRNDFTNEKIYSALYPGNEYKESVLKTMLSRLHNLGEEYLVYREFGKEDNMYRDCIKLKALNERGLKTRVVRHISNIENLQLKKKAGKDQFIDKKNFLLERSYFLYNNEKREIVPVYLNESIKYIIYSFITELFHYDFSMYTQRNFWKFDYENSYVSNILDSIDFESILSLIEKNDKKEFPFIRLSYLMHLSIKYLDRDDLYFELKDLIYKHLSGLDYSFKKQLLNLLALICSLKFVSGKNEFKVHAFEIKKKIVQEDLFSMTGNSYIKTSEFRSAFIEALNVNEKKWAEDFASNYIKRLQPVFRKDIENYCRSRIAYENEKYDESIEYAMKVNINQITFKLDIKNVMAKIYYDTESVESLYSHLNAYYQIVKNSGSQNKEFLQRQLKFIKYLKELQNIKSKFQNKQELEFLRDKISMENVTAKSWLMKKIDFLINS